MTSIRRSSRPIKRKKFFEDTIVDHPNIGTELDSLDASDLSTEIPPESTVSHSPLTKRKSDTHNSNYSKNSKTSDNKGPILSTRFLSHAHYLDQLGRWKPLDDYKLIINVLQCNDIRRVSQWVTFTSKFTVKDLEDRWQALMYDPVISAMAQKSMAEYLIQRPEYLVRTVFADAIFSDAEEKILGQFYSNKSHSLDAFQELLLQNSETFLPARTATQLQKHWLSLKHFNLLPDQIVNGTNFKFTPTLFHGYDCHDMPQLVFEDMEKLLIISSEIQENSISNAFTNQTQTFTGNSKNTNCPAEGNFNSVAKNLSLDSNTAINLNFGSDLPNSESLANKLIENCSFLRRSNKVAILEAEHERATKLRLSRIVALERQIQVLQEIVDKEMGTPREMDDSTYAILKGKNVRYLIKSHEVTFGRNPISMSSPNKSMAPKSSMTNTLNNSTCNQEEEKPLIVDIDLSLEGPLARKISRLQGRIQLVNFSAVLNDETKTENQNTSSGNKPARYGFQLLNQGSRTVYIEGIPVPTGQRAQIPTFQNRLPLIEVAGISLVFHANTDVLARMR